MVSIIIPVYNTERYLAQCLESVLAQTADVFECILVDDGSTDSYGLICDQYVERDKRFLVLHQKNQGVSSARNNGMEVSKGEYITFVDSDDYIDSRYLQLLLENIEPGGLSTCNMRNVGDAVYLENTQRLSPSESQVSSFSAHGIGGVCGGKIV